MISNAIAEMRTYGEGFIIADQAPGLLDMAAIRNTNTKVILRLPDQSDRELAGKAAGLQMSKSPSLLNFRAVSPPSSRTSGLSPYYAKSIAQKHPNRYIDTNESKSPLMRPAKRCPQYCRGAIRRSAAWP